MWIQYTDIHKYLHEYHIDDRQMIISVNIQEYSTCSIFTQCCNADYGDCDEYILQNQDADIWNFRDKQRLYHSIDDQHSKKIPIRAKQDIS
jgi:hypothetical protein